MFTRRRHMLGLSLALSDIALTAIAFELAYILRQHLPDMRLFFFERSLLIELLASVVAVWWGVGTALGIYRRPELYDALRIVRDTLRQAVVGTAVLMGWLYMLKVGDVSRSFTILFASLHTVLL